LNILSVEALANLPDQPLRKLGPDCYELQRRAKEFLAGAATNSRITELQEQLTKALARIAELEKPVEKQIEAEPVIVPSPEIPVKAVEKSSTEVSSKTVTHTDGRTWSGRGRKPQWVKDMGK
jgi:DNA-binding protein H-NS